MTTASDDFKDKNEGKAMRTRLDEIVEQEMRLAIGLMPAGPHEYGKRIAERAFRHGVEMHQKMSVGHNAIWCGEVQPAPAAPPACTNLINGVWCRCHCDDRRRGVERRKGGEKRAIRWFKGDCIGIWQGNSHMFWNDDRRTGSDRRTSPSTDRRGKK